MRESSKNEGEIDVCDDDDVDDDDDDDDDDTSDDVFTFAIALAA